MLVVPMLFGLLELKFAVILKQKMQAT